SPANRQDTVSPVVPPANVEPSIPAFGRPPVIEADIPSFAAYLPPNRIVVSDKAPPADSAEQETRLQEPIAAVTTLETAAPEETSKRPKKPDTPAETAPTAARRTPRSRARHARNVRPEPAPAGLSRTELWAKVPEHVETLLALERLEEEKEV